MVGLSIQNISKSIVGKPVLDSISFTAPGQKITAILGPSGCGKSTLLRIIAGLERHEQGEVFWNEQKYTHIPAHRRGFGLMFQDNALFPHLNVYQNIAFGLKLSKTPKNQIKRKVGELLTLINLVGFENREIHNLSGGEAQRVALARTLAPEPCLLMLDEPLGSLDRTLKERLLTELRMILRELQLTTLYVTHDQEEAFTIADQVILLNQGSIEQIGTPQDIYHSPASLFVAKFLGFKNILTAFGEGNFAQTPLGMLPLPASVHGEFTLLIRPDAILPAQDGSLNLQGNIVEKLFQGSLCRTTVDIQGTLLQFNFSSQACALAENQPISLSLDPQKAFLILPKP